MSDAAWCPRCDKPRRHEARGRLYVACGSDECFRLASPLPKSISWSVIHGHCAMAVASVLGDLFEAAE